MKLNVMYARLSEEDVNKTKKYSESILNQIELIEEFAKEHNIKIDKRFIDEGYSGINFSRPQFEEMIKEIENDNIGIVITKDFSRLGREFIETNFYITGYFPEHDVRYIAINESYDSVQENNDVKEMMVAITGVINDRYIKDTSMKIKEVKKQKTEKGYYMGFIAPYGYKKIRTSDGRITLKEDNEVSYIVKEIFQNVIDGLSREEIAKRLNEKEIISPMQYMNMTKSRGKRYGDKWTSGIIYRIIRNETYIGNTYKRKSKNENYRIKKREYIAIKDREKIENTHPAIISKEMFEKANVMIKTNLQKINRLKDYEKKLDGIVKCGECGKVLSVSGRKKESGRIIYSFYCTDGKNKNKECCNTKTIFTNKLEQIVFDIIKQNIEKLNEDKIIKDTSEYIIEKRRKKNEIQMLKKEIEILKNKIKDLYLKRVENKISIEKFIETRKNYNEEIKNKEQRIIQTEKDAMEENQIQKLKEKYKEFKNESNLMEYAHDLVKEIKFYNNRNLKITVNFDEER